MTEQKKQLASLFAACWKDEALKARFRLTSRVDDRGFFRNTDAP